jgi:very-short-patch-repair endonuclease
LQALTPLPLSREERGDKTEFCGRNNMKEIKKQFARDLRKDQTLTEAKVWKLLRNRRYLELKFRRQLVIEGFVVDFFCKELKLGIEIDGGIHLNNKEYDDIRQMIIESEGIRIIRITNEEIQNNPKILFDKIKQAIENNSARFPSPRSDRGEGLGVRVEPNV